MYIMYLDQSHLVTLSYSPPIHVDFLHLSNHTSLLLFSLIFAFVMH